MTPAVLNDSLPTTPAPLEMSYEEFLARPGEEKAEWVDGRVFFMSPLSEEHQETGLFLLRIMTEWVEVHQSGVIRYEKFLMKIGPNSPGREPDILFVSKENKPRLKRTFLDGPADLVVEIISTESRARDRGEKFYEYEAGGVREYWLLDPQRKQAEWYQLGDDNIYHPTIVGEDGIYRSRVLEGLWLREAWLWQPPKLRDVLREWELI